MRPLGVQVLNLAYRSGVAWNETGFSNPEFDALLDRPTASPMPTSGAR
jgi:peptide/nickel transport system substrate-binding protein